jgi:aquaporin Z
MTSAFKSYFAELIGTAALVFIGCGAVCMGGLGGALGSDGPLAALALLPIGIAFGLAVTAMAYGIGPVSGCHINPAVSIGAWAAGRIDLGTLIGYIIAQCAGAIVGAGVLYVILSGKQGGWDLATNGLGQTTFSTNCSILSAFVAEFVGTFLFLVVILGATSEKGATPAAGLAIGLTLVIIHLVLIKFTGSSVNPARSLGSAVFAGGTAISDLWLYFVAPPLGALLAGLLFRAKALEA